MHPLTLPKDWPHRDTSRHIACKPHLWHVQQMGQGATLLLIHGAGGATHSFRHLMPILAAHYHVVAIDLPGQGFTRLGARNRCGLDPMAQDIARLCAQENWHPTAIIGHSAGAAIALRLAQLIPTQAIIGINAALGSFDGVAGWLFPMMAKLLSLTPLVPQLFSKLSGNPARVHSLLTSTGSHLDLEGESQYLTLIRSAGHVDATLAMMAQWRLDPLLASLPALHTPCLLITAAKDSAVPPTVSANAAQRMPHASHASLATYGHLVHEEAAAAVANLILPFLAAQMAPHGDDRQ
jgi:magnesium chelatase accessory protein